MPEPAARVGVERVGVERVAVVVPALNEARCIESCLRSITAQEPGVEIAVVDGGSADDTVSFAAPYARVIASARGRAVQMNAGARATTGDVLLFLHADTRLPTGAIEAIRGALADPRVAGGTFTLRFDPETPMLRLYAWATRVPWRLLHYGDQGIFVRRSAFEGMGGYQELPIMEDVDFLARLARRGRVVLIPLAVTTSARRFARHGVVRQQLRNGVLLGLYALGVSPHRLARWYENVSR